MDETKQPESGHRTGRLSGFGRRHPALTAVGLAAAGLIAGPELAVGVLIGASVASLLRRPTESLGETPTRLHDLRQRFGERARAVVNAARGEMDVPGH